VDKYEIIIILWVVKPNNKIITKLFVRVICIIWM